MLHEAHHLCTQHNLHNGTSWQQPPHCHTIVPLKQRRALSRISPRVRVRVSVSIECRIGAGGYSWIWPKETAIFPMHQYVNRALSSENKITNLTHHCLLLACYLHTSLVSYTVHLHTVYVTAPKRATETIRQYSIHTCSVTNGRRDSTR